MYSGIHCTNNTYTAAFSPNTEHPNSNSNITIYTSYSRELGHCKEINADEMLYHVWVVCCSM